ncbi:uncharacterized protein LOC126326526 isoform X2 [Schistocerca gregaria]|uniref:uncharacterized protein LOC126326526 isoform X2 n=1 Tax=Schistocerca gregaria TaxID=7010 RepID=UPI00211EE5DA|nr:uncharacterized protein LOC126326526 isoform X2 [Schistocerca gregaria]
MDAVLPEDWALEIETLKHVFLDQFKEQEKPNEFELTLLPNPDASSEDENRVGLVLRVRLNRGYPDEMPSLSLSPLKSVTARETRDLLERLCDQGRELLGMQMLYPLAQFLVDWLIERNMSELEKMKDSAERLDELDRMAEQEEYERRNKDGTMVTKENFDAWFRDFLARHPEKIQMPKEGGVAVPKDRLTGREYFEQSALKGLSLEGLPTSEEQANVNWKLFALEEAYQKDE